MYWEKSDYINIYMYNYVPAKGQKYIFLKFVYMYNCFMSSVFQNSRI